LLEEPSPLKDRPLSGQRIVVAEGQSAVDELVRGLVGLGAEVLEVPTVRIEPPTDLRAFAELVQDAHSYDWIVFSTSSGVAAFFDLFYKLYDDAREIGGARIAAIGPAAVERMKDFHLKVELHLDEFVPHAIVREFQKQGSIENMRILVARAEKAQDLLPKQLSALGAIVDEAFAYRVVPETRDHTGALRRLLEEGADLIAFTSPTTVEDFVALDLPPPRRLQAATNGPATSAAVRRHGLKVAVEADRHDVAGFIESICTFILQKKTD
jgi:uroporphyrinogen III methyltransferase/synthase